MSSLIPLSEVSTYYTPKLKQFLVDLGKIAQTMNIVEMVTPVNTGEEKRKWLEKAARGEWTNPSFQYNTELLVGVARPRFCGNGRLYVWLHLADEAKRWGSIETDLDNLFPSV